MIFIDDLHEEFYIKTIKATGSQVDRERQALFYALGLLVITRNHINDLYNFQDNEIKLTGLFQPWQTGSTLKICRLAFNLFNGFTGLEKNRADQPRDYSPYCLFNNALLPYMLEAVKIRYSNYL